MFLCVFSIQHHFLELYNTSVTIPEGSVNSVQLLGLPLNVLFPCQSTPYSFTIDEYNSD